jgi:large subunit ribosomal protein L25
MGGMELSVVVREKMRGQVKSLLEGGFIPAELYGHGIPNVHISVPAKEFGKIFKEAGENTVVTLVIGAQKHPVLIHNVQRNFLTGDLIHIDFYQVNMKEAIVAKIPLEFIGDAPAVREQGATVNKSMLELEVEALPNDLPHRLTVDISTLDEMNKSIYVRDIVVPAGVKILVDPETAVATATPPAAEEVVVEPIDISAVKVEAEEKKAERQAGKETEE